MLEIKQFGDWNTRTAIKELVGVKAYVKDNEWYFSIDENIVDLDEMKKLLPSDEYKKLCMLYPQNIEFANLFKDISQITDFPKKRYSVVGDVESAYSLSDKLSMCIIIDDHNTKRALAIILKPPFEANDLKEKRIRVTGELGIYSPYARFQLENISEIKIIGPCSRLVEYEEAEKQYKEYFKTLDQQKKCFFEFQKIGVISNEASRGYRDFIKNLKSTTIGQENIILENIKMTQENMIGSIKKLNEMNECQGICIIRGGGSPEELIDFNKPDLLGAILESNIPVVTGIGHVTDFSLCDYVAAYNAGTPTGVAEYFNYLIRKKYAIEKARTKNVAVKIIRNKQKEVEEKCESLEKEKIQLQKEIKQLQLRLAAIQEQSDFSIRSLIKKLFKL